MKFSMEQARRCCQPKPRPSLCSIFRSFIGLWEKIWHGSKTACSKSNPVQSSRSKSTTCPRKGRRFELNSTATSDGGAQKLGNDVRKDSESIATKFAAIPVANEMRSHVVTSLDRKFFKIDLKVFWAFCLCKQSSTVLLTNHHTSHP